jgi:hypothetical protein
MHVGVQEVKHYENLFAAAGESLAQPIYDALYPLAFIA